MKKFDTTKKHIPKEILAEKEFKTADSSVKIIVHPKSCHLYTMDDEGCFTDLRLRPHEILALIEGLAYAHSLILGQAKEIHPAAEQTSDDKK